MDVGRMLVAAGLLLVLVGLVVWLLERSGFRGLPGDLRFESGNLRVYFPIVTCLALSLILTLALWLWNWFQRR
jgi:hypothetical protein